MKLKQPLRALLVAVLLISGCTLIQPKGNELASKVDSLLAKKAYGDALDLLSRVSPDSPDYSRFAEKRKQVEGLAAQYERKTLEEARQLVAQDRWAHALTLYDQALERLPRSTQLRDGLAELHKQQQIHLAAQNNELLIARGEWLMTVISVYRRMANIDPRNESWQKQLDDYQHEGTLTAESLLAVGTQAQKSGNEELASRALQLATHLSDKKEIQQATQKYAKDNRNQQDKRWRELAQREQERNEAIHQLTADYTKAMKQKDYQSARITLGKLRSFAPELVNEKGYEKDLNDKILVESNRLYNEGVIYYGRSQFENARNSWKKTLELTPTHSKARESLERVEKVLERITQLRKKQNKK